MQCTLQSAASASMLSRLLENREAANIRVNADDGLTVSWDINGTEELLTIK